MKYIMLLDFLMITQKYFPSCKFVLWQYLKNQRNNMLKKR